MYLSTVRRRVFITLGANAVSQAHPGTLSRCGSRCLGLPAQGQALFIVICITYICSVSCCLLELGEPGACS